MFLYYHLCQHSMLWDKGCDYLSNEILIDDFKALKEQTKALVKKEQDKGL